MSEQEKKASKDKLKEKVNLRFEQTTLFECFLCHHSYPPSYLKFGDRIWCKDRETCQTHWMKKYEYYVKAIEGDRKWWQKQKRKLKAHQLIDEQVYDEIKEILKDKWQDEWKEHHDKKVAHKAKRDARKAKKTENAEGATRDASPERGTKV